MPFDITIRQVIQIFPSNLCVLAVIEFFAVKKFAFLQSPRLAASRSILMSLSGSVFSLPFDLPSAVAIRLWQGELLRFDFSVRMSDGLEAHLPRRAGSLSSSLQSIRLTLVLGFANLLATVCCHNLLLPLVLSSF